MGEFRQWQSRAKQRREASGLGGASALVRGEPDYSVGPIASGPVVSAATGFSRWVRQRNRQCAAIEMEGSGVAEAIYQHGGTNMLIVRGISDFADERKQQLDATPAAHAEDSAWRRYATLNAVDLLATLVRGPDFPWSPATGPRRAQVGSGLLGGDCCPGSAP